MKFMRRPPPLTIRMCKHTRVGLRVYVYVREEIIVGAFIVQGALRRRPELKALHIYRENCHRFLASRESLARAGLISDILFFFLFFLIVLAP